MVVLARPSPTPTPLPAEVTPPGITRVGGTTYTGTKKAWIIDTGIDLTHPDLKVDAASGRHLFQGQQLPMMTMDMALIVLG
jgi:hypothetical protein